MTERTVRPERLVVMSPALDQDLDLKQRVEDLAIEKLGAELPVERFDIAILPPASGRLRRGENCGLALAEDHEARGLGDHFAAIARRQLEAPPTRTREG